MADLQTHKQGPAWDYLQKWGYLKKRVSIGLTHAAAILYNGTARACGGYNFYNCLNFEHWDNLKEIICSSVATIGLCNDGKVKFAGAFLGGDEVGIHPEQWHNDIVSISASKGDHNHLLGLTKNGTVCAYGSNYNNQCDVSDWNDIVEICALDGLSLGLKKDGTVVVQGNDFLSEQTLTWKNIEHIYCATPDLLVGLQFNGKVLVASSRDIFHTDDWEDIITISCGNNTIAGIKGNGDAYLTGDLSPSWEKELHHILSISISPSEDDEDFIFVHTYEKQIAFAKQFPEKIDFKNSSIMDILFGYKSPAIAGELRCAGCIRFFKDKVPSEWLILFDEAFDPTKYAPSEKSSEPEQVDPEQSGSDSVDSQELVLYGPEDVGKSDEKTKYLILGIICLFIFWPVSIYFFYKYSQC